MTDPERSPSSFFAELKRRRVGRAAGAYAAGAFVVLQAADLLLPALSAPDGAFRLLVILTIAGFPVALVLSWLFELTSEGIRRAARRGEGRLVLRFRPAIAWGAGILLLLLFVGSLAWPRLRAATAGVAAGADVIAVVPFLASGLAVESLREGMVDLLSRNLDEIGSIRTVDPRAVLARWRERAGGGELSGEELLAVGRDVDAGSVLTGSIVAVGGRVRIQAELLDLEGGRLASTTVEGDESRVLELVDSLAVSLIREVWRGNRPVPNLDLAAVTSTNPTALRLFLAGERLVRASDWSGAAAALEGAVEADSTFALAYYRLSQVAGWTRGLSRSREAYIDLADRHSERLPGRMRGILATDRMVAEGRWEEAVDSLRALVARFPDDADVRLSLADAEYHLRDEGAAHGARPLDEQLAGFDRALELDPGYLPALIHPLEVAFLYADTARLARYAEYVRAIESVPPAAVGIVERGIAALADSVDLVQITSTLGQVLEALDAADEDFRWQAARAVAPAVIRRAVTLPASDGEVVTRWLSRRLEQDPEAGPEAAAALVRMLTATGRLSAARAFLDSETARRLLPRNARDALLSLPVLAGIDDRPYEARPAGAEGGGDGRAGDAAAGDAEERGPVLSATFELLAAVDRRESGAARTAAARLERLAGGLEPDAARRARLLARLGRALAAVVSEPGGRGLAEAEAALREAATADAHWQEAGWLRWLELAVERPTWRARALDLLARPWPGSAAYEPRRLLALARGLDADGRPRQSAEAYEALLTALSAADPDAGIRTAISEAEAALRRLGSIASAPATPGRRKPSVS